MATYLILNLVFIAILLVWWLIAKPPVKLRTIGATIGILVIFTAVFDSLIVSLGIVDYDYAKTLGLTIGTAPLEDFFYAILAGALVPAVWSILGGNHERKS